MNKLVLSNEDVMELAYKVALKIAAQHGTTNLKIWGIPRSGIPAAYAVMMALCSIGATCTYAASADEASIIVDDVIDSAATINRYMEAHHEHAYFACLVDKVMDRPRNPILDYHQGLPMMERGKWIVFPWDLDESGKDTGAQDSVVRMLQYIGEDSSREGLRETPNRVVKAWSEWFAGYRTDPKSLFKSFEDGAEGVNEMVLLTDIPVFSHCEHHIAPFTGTASVAYIPDGKIVGLSKIARVVDAFSRRLQVQERLTNQIADCIMQELQPLGAAVVIRAKHSCMSTRGVKVHNVDTTTSAMRGVFMEDAAVRNEFMLLAR